MDIQVNKIFEIGAHKRVPVVAIRNMEQITPTKFEELHYKLEKDYWRVQFAYKTRITFNKEREYIIDAETRPDLGNNFFKLEGYCIDTNHFILVEYFFEKGEEPVQREDDDFFVDRPQRPQQILQRITFYDCNPTTIKSYLKSIELDANWVKKSPPPEAESSQQAE